MGWAATLRQLSTEQSGLETDGIFTGLSVEKAASLLENTKLREGFTISGRFTVDLSGKIAKGHSGQQRRGKSHTVRGPLTKSRDMIGEYIEKRR
jgi:hypothetical protein